MMLLSRLLALGTLLASALAIDLVRPADFNNGKQGWKFSSDSPNLARGTRNDAMGKLTVSIASKNRAPNADIAGEWTRDFVVEKSGVTGAQISFDYTVAQSPSYEPDETTIVYARLDGRVIGPPYVRTLVGDGNGGARNDASGKATISLGSLGAGEHSVRLGLYVSSWDRPNEKSKATFDNVRITGEKAEPLPDVKQNPQAAAAVRKLKEKDFRKDIASLAGFGDRGYQSEGNERSAVWLERQLRAMGYKPQRAAVNRDGDVSKEFSVYATKEGSEGPMGGMYIVSAHFDGLGGGGAVNDDGAGCALVLAVARSLRNARSKKSVRFVFWNAEEVGLFGSQRYAETRRELQGTPEEPVWLGLIQHDQILYDHGPFGAPVQASDADIDIEYQGRSSRAAASQALAQQFAAYSSRYARAYPSMVSDNMRNTDSVPFQDLVASISIRDNTRDEIGAGSNPHWHQATDVVSTFSDLDFAFGFNVVKMTVASVWDLVNARQRQ